MFTGEIQAIDNCSAGLIASILCPSLNYGFLPTLPSVLLEKKRRDMDMLFFKLKI